MRLAALLGLALSVGADHPTPFPRAPLGEGLHAPQKPRLRAPIEPVFSGDGGSALTVAKIGGHTLLLVADEEEDAIHSLDLETRREVARTDLFGGPSQLLVVGDRVAVSLRRAGSIALLSAESFDRPLAIASTIATADEPIALARREGDLFVASGWGRTLEAFSLRDGAKTFSLPLGREPRALAISSDGARAFVGYLAEAKVDVIDLSVRVTHEAKLETASFAVPVFDTPIAFPCFVELGEEMHCHSAPRRPSMRTVPARAGRQTFSFARVAGARERILVPHLEVGPGEPNVQTGGYGASEPSRLPHELDVASIDANTGALSPHRLALPLGTDGCRLPRASVFADRTLFLACAGDDRVASYAYDGDSVTPKARIAVGGGPSALAIDPEHTQILTLSSFDRTVRVLSFDLATTIATIPLSHREGVGLAGDALAGRELFHRTNDLRISADGRACASCHAEGRDDGLVWPTPNGPRQTIFLAGRLGRDAPFGWDAEHASIVAHVKVTVRNLGGTGLPDGDLEKLAAYVMALPAPPRRALALPPDAARGRELFAADSVGCSSCHVETTGFTDNGAHDVKSAVPADRKKTFLVPSLRLLEGSAPYFHDGRYATLDALVRGCDGSMGSTKQLSEADVNALTAYLRTL